MLSDIHFQMNSVVINQLALDSVDSCLDNTLQILCKCCCAIPKGMSLFWIWGRGSNLCWLFYTAQKLLGVGTGGFVTFRINI